MNQQEVVDLMKSSKNEQEWNDNCDKVKKACGGYPDFWYPAVIMSGLAKETLGAGKDEIKVVPLG